MAVNDVYKATAFFTAPTAEGEMTFNVHYRTVTVNTPEGDGQEALDIADRFRAMIELNYLLFIPTEVVFERVTVVGVTNPLIGVEQISGNTGGGGVNPLSYRSAPVVKLRSGLRGRSYNGRIYLLCPDESQQTGGTMLTTYVASLATFVESIRLLTGIVSLNEFQATIYSPTLSEGGPIIDNIVESFVINPRLGSQRSRQSVV